MAKWKIDIFIGTKNIFNHSFNDRVNFENSYKNIVVPLRGDFIYPKKMVL